MLSIVWVWFSDKFNFIWTKKDISTFLDLLGLKRTGTFHKISLKATLIFPQNKICALCITEVVSVLSAVSGEEGKSDKC